MSVRSHYEDVRYFPDLGFAGLNPSDEMAFALAHGKLGSVHLNDQNGLKYDQGKNFGTANLRAAFNQVRVFVGNDYDSDCKFIGINVKAKGTQRRGLSLVAQLQVT